MKNIFKSFAVAFSMYSKIPMPRFEWDSIDMKYHLCFFPFVGAVIGGLIYFWWHLGIKLDISKAATVILGITIPVFVTGGFHLDGFMDTMDAIHSYQPKGKKIEILKDPHIGAFSVICIITFFLLAAGFCFEIKKHEALIAICFSFVISRILSGLSVIIFPKAKKEGMLAVESKTGEKKIVAVVLFAELTATSSALLFFTVRNSICGIISLCAFAVSFAYYYFMSRKNFGGITGDLAGFFVCLGELTSLAGISACCIFGV